MDLTKILEELEKGTQKELQLAEDEDFKKFMKGAMALKGTAPPKSSASFGSYEEDLKALYGKDEVERLREELEDVPNKDANIFNERIKEMGDAYAKGLVSKKSVMEQLLSNMSMGADDYYKKVASRFSPDCIQVESKTKMSAPVRPQVWTQHKPSYEREYEITKEMEHFHDTVFGPFPGDKSEDTIEQLRHLLTQAQANRAQADERTCKKPCRFLKESVRDSDVSGVPVGVRQRCAHPVFEQKSMYSLLSLYAEMLNVTEKFCVAMVKSNPEVLDALPTARRIALAASQSLLITPRENNKDLIVGYLTDLDFLRTKVVEVIDEMKKNHALTVADDRYFTHEEQLPDSTKSR